MQPFLHHKKSPAVRGLDLGIRENELRSTFFKRIVNIRATIENLICNSDS